MSVLAYSRPEQNIATDLKIRHSLTWLMKSPAMDTA
jgi:hypothetical protein